MMGLPVAKSKYICKRCGAEIKKIQECSYSWKIVGGIAKHLCATAKATAAEPWSEAWRFESSAGKPK